jgi:hypothetical protein
MRRISYAATSMRRFGGLVAASNWWDERNASRYAHAFAREE